MTTVDGAPTPPHRPAPPEAPAPAYVPGASGRERRPAVVVGASIAGLLAARVLTEAYDRVILIERGSVGPGEAWHGGPQREHAHAMLAGGRALVEELLPGFTDELVSRGARCDDIGRALVFCVGPLRLATGDAGVRGLSGGRQLLESALRRRVAALPGVEIRAQTSVLDLLFDDTAAVVGVRVTGGEVDEDEDVLADLVVDASGRCSHTPIALARHGYAPPVQEQQRIDLRYTTRRFRLPPEDDGGWTAIVQGIGPGLRRAGIALHEHGDRWVVSLSAYGAEQPPRDLDGFLDFARALPRPELADLVARMEPLDDGAHFRVVSNVRRRYELLERLPEGLLVVGDALCSFDPSFGHGMSVAAAHAHTLRRCLRELEAGGGTAGPRGMGRLFFPRAAGDLTEPWDAATRRYRLVTDRPPVTVVDRLAGAYIGAVIEGATRDPRLARAFLRVAQLTAPSSSLFTPAVAAAAFRARLVATLGRPVPRAAAAGPPSPAPDLPVAVGPVAKRS